MRLIDADALIEFCAERWIPLNVDAVNMQPTIQPVATDTNVGDIISRQQAIDAIVNCTNCGDEKTLREYVAMHNLENMWSGGVLETLDAVKDLPSAQPYAAEEIQKVQELVAVQIEKAYELGRESVQPKQEWIPVSERLPEDGENVLVTYKTTDKIHPCQYHDDGSRNPWYSYIDQCREHMNVVLAWMPLSEPYQSEEERRTDG